MAGVICLIVFFVLLAAVPLTRTAGVDPAVAMAGAVYRSGALVFGGGHVVLPLLDAGVVEPGWVGESQFLAGYGAAQAVPGPLFSFAAYLGAVATPLGGVGGGAVALVAIYLPSFLLLFGVLPFWDRLRRSASFRRALVGVNAAVVGLLAAALYQPVWTGAVGSVADVAVIAVALAALVAGPAAPDRSGRRLRRRGPAARGVTRQIAAASSSSVATTAAAPADRSASPPTADPASTPIATMPAATAETMSQVESPMYQQRAGSTPISSAAYSRRSGSGFACLTWLASMIVGSSASPSAATDAPTWSLRLDVAIAHGMPAASIAVTIARDPGQRPRPVQSFVDLAGRLVDLLGAGLVDRPTGERRDLAGQSPPVEPDHRRQLFVRRREAGLLQRLEPRVDPRPDRVDQRAVEVEQDRGGPGQRGEVGHRQRIPRRARNRGISAAARPPARSPGFRVSSSVSGISSIASITNPSAARAFT